MAKVSTRNITAQNVSDIVLSAHISYWSRDAVWSLTDGTLTFTEVGDGDENIDHTVTAAQIRSAVVALAEDYSPIQQAFTDWSAEDGIDTGEIDSLAADMIVQQAAFGEVVYS